MAKKHHLEDGIARLTEQLPNVTNAFHALRDEAAKDGVWGARTKRLMMVAVAVAFSCEPAFERT